MFAFELLNCVAFNLSPDTSISTITISTIGIRSGISIVSIESISLWFSISITLAVVSISVDSGMVWEGDSLGHSVKSLGDGVKTGAGAKWHNWSNQDLGVSLSISLAWKRLL